MGGDMIIGTAGHVDHGKSTLITALTGRAMDRLAEERRRGITIDLNFAPFDLPDGSIAGVIDVPGHEDFVRTMVAGASSVDVALLVIAADEGIMPQTLEHLLVLERLGVPRGIPVLTKADLVEPDWLALVRDDLAGRLAGSPVAFEAPIVVSARTGQGLDELRARLVLLAASTAARDRDDTFRLPVDRSFSLAGVGTVVTGTCWSGTVETGSEVRVLPAGARARVRSIETHGRVTASAEPGTRTALGLAGIHRDDAPRGGVVVLAESPWEATRVLDVVLGLDRGDRVSRRTRLRVHLGTADVPAWAAPRAPIDAGGSGLARLTLDRPIVARGGDHFVVRSLAPAAVIGGGVVLDPLPERRAPWPDRLSSADPAERLDALVARRRAGLPLESAPIIAGVPRRRVERILRERPSLRRLDVHVVSTESVDAARARMQAALDDHHGGHPAERGMPLETLRRSAAAAEYIAEAALAGLRESGAIVVTGGSAAARGFRSRVAGGDSVVAEVVARLEAAGLEPPTVPELAALCGRPDLPAILRLAAAEGSVEAVERERYFARTALDGFARTVEELGERGEITVGRLREALGLSRKYLIPLLEWADRRGITVRTGDTRRLKRVDRVPPAAT